MSDDAASNWWEAIVVEDILASTEDWSDPFQNVTIGLGLEWSRSKVVELVRRINDTWAEEGVGKIVEYRTDMLVQVVCRWCGEPITEDRCA